MSGKQTGRWGFINADGEEVIPCKWDHVGDFHHERADVGRDNKCGYIDKRGKLVVPCEWDESIPVPGTSLYRLSAQRQSLAELPIFGSLLYYLGFQESTMASRMMAVANQDGQIIWRSDLHALRSLLPLLSAMFAVPSLLLFRSARPRAVNVAVELRLKPSLTS